MSSENKDKDKTKIEDKCEKGYGATVKDFLITGNVVDIAVGLIIAVAFGNVITSLVQDLIMPLIAKIGNGSSFTDKFVVLSNAQYKTIQDLIKAGIVPADTQFKTIEEAKLAGIDVIDQSPVSSYAEGKQKGTNFLAWGNFIQLIIQFIIIGLILATLMYAIAKLKCTLSFSPNSNSSTLNS